MGCGTKTSKYLLLGLHLLIFGVGVTLLVSGLFLTFTRGFWDIDVVKMLMLVKEGNIYFGLQLMLIGYMTIASGGFVIVLAFLGFIGTWKKVKVLHILFIIFAIVTLLIQATVVGLWIHTRAGTDEWLEGQLKDKLKEYGGPTSTDTVSSGFNTMFMDGRCCGVSSTGDFASLSTAWHQGDGTANGESIPATCCKGVTSDNVNSYVNSACTNAPIADYYEEGCISVFKSVVELYSKVAYITVPIGFVLKVLAIVMSCVNIDKNKNQIRPAKTTPTKPYIGIDQVLKNSTKRH